MESPARGKRRHENPQMMENAFFWRIQFSNQADDLTELDPHLATCNTVMSEDVSPIEDGVLRM